MEFKFRAIDGKASTYIPPPPPPYSSTSYFTEQALRVRYPATNFGNSTDYFRNPSDVREAVQREVEKEQIRREIIAEEIAQLARRRVLEAEVRREMMVEREMLLRGGGSGGSGSGRFSVFSGSAACEPRMSILGPSDGRSLEERIIMALEERLPRRGSGIGGSETVPFQRSAEPKISEVTPPSEVRKEKEKVIFLAKPEGNLSGSKRKAVTPPAAGVTERPSVGSKKKHKEEWSCAICQVSATSERGLNEHLQGKKHKAKEAGLRAEKTGKNYAIGLFPKKASKPIKLVELTSNKISELGEKLEGEKSKTEGDNQNNVLALTVIQDNIDSKHKDGELLQKVLENGESKRERFKFWCEMCQVGAFSEKVMNKHKKGKKHVGRLERLDQNGKSVMAARVEGVPRKGSDAEAVDKDENKETPENANVAADGEAVENHEATKDVAGGSD